MTPGTGGEDPANVVIFAAAFVGLLVVVNAVLDRFTRMVGWLDRRRRHREGTRR